MESLILNFQHKFNPLHIYCRLLDKGFDPQISLRLSRCYEILIYKWLTLLDSFFNLPLSNYLKKYKVLKD